jgi:hypothetical protein
VQQRYNPTFAYSVYFWDNNISVKEELAGVVGRAVSVVRRGYDGHFTVVEACAVIGLSRDIEYGGARPLQSPTAPVGVVTVKNLAPPPSYSASGYS